MYTSEDGHINTYKHVHMYKFTHVCIPDSGYAIMYANTLLTIKCYLNNLNLTN